MGTRSTGSLLANKNEVTSFEQNTQKLAINIEKLERESHIDTFEQIDEKITRDGLIRTIGFTTMAGHAYAAIVGMPREQTSAVPMIGTSAWFTSIEGHNEHTARVFMRKGNPIMFVGSEGSFHNHSNHGGNLSGITLARSAAAVLRFSGEVVGDYPDLDQEKRTAIGESRGAMVGMGIMALDTVFDQDVLYADLTAPCFPRKFNILTDPLKLACHLKHEPRTLVSLAGKLPWSLLRHYPATVDPHINAFTHQVAIWSALFSGEAGDLARLIPDKKVMHVTTYDDDAASMHKLWVEIFERHDGVRVTPLGGSHLSLADPQTLAYLIARNQKFQEQVRVGRGIQANMIFDGAHEIVQDQLAS